MDWGPRISILSMFQTKQSSILTAKQLRNITRSTLENSFVLIRRKAYLLSQNIISRLCEDDLVLIQMKNNPNVFKVYKVKYISRIDKVSIVSMRIKIKDYNKIFNVRIKLVPTS